MITIKKITYLLVGIILFSSCSKDYLSTKPSSSTATPTIFETTKNAALAINGINVLMTTQLLGTQGFNGEGTIKLYYGIYPGNNTSINLPGWASIINGTFRENVSSIYLYYPWYYYYMLIGHSHSGHIATLCYRRFTATGGRIPTTEHLQALF